MTEIALHVPDELVEAIAQRVAELLRVEGSSTGADPLLTVPEAAIHLRAGRQRVYDLVNDGRLNVERDGRRVLIRQSTLDAHLRRGS